MNIILLHCSVSAFSQSSNPLFATVEKVKSQKIDSLINFNADKNAINKEKNKSKK